MALLGRRGEEFLYELKAGPAGGRLRRPSSAGRPDWGMEACSVPAESPPPKIFKDLPYVVLAYRRKPISKCQYSLGCPSNVARHI
jgi:hypothetical protein